ncbi:hypothetical protein BCR34DRAFT_584447 [Clohesyomyces aquaticus]|uniref:Ribosome biogenesis protein YTM1 n=1 Tax=Clohesyomyces aquaticus TaxID=1231657 RepID=A0A1Y2A1P0_9PLEO|nr:hypothetical protein BCR34DRAFT_584447 [Clohesyomyces aquaticus]
MSSHTSAEDIGEALLNSVESGVFPQNEQVASASIFSYDEFLRLIYDAWEHKKNAIRLLSRHAAADIDGWLNQARKLRVEIEASIQKARRIAQQTQSGKDYTERIQDAASTTSFLHSELAYNVMVVTKTELFKDIMALLESVRRSVVDLESVDTHALDELAIGLKRLDDLGSFKKARVAGLLRTQADNLQASALSIVSKNWYNAISKDTTIREITIDRSRLLTDETVEALVKLDKLNMFIADLNYDLNHYIVGPCLVPTANGGPAFSLQFLSHSMRAVPSESVYTTHSAVKAVRDAHEVVLFLSTHLPHSVTRPLSKTLVLWISRRLIKYWLGPSIPLSLEEVQPFEKLLYHVRELIKYLDRLEWDGQEILTEFVNTAPDKWLSTRTADALAKVRRICASGLREKKAVERVETQMVSKGDAMLGEGEEKDDDWSGQWGEDDETSVASPAAETETLEEEDVSAWGIDDDDTLGETESGVDDRLGDIKSGVKPSGREEHSSEDVESWDWEEEETTTGGKSVIAQDSAEGKEVTLKERYFVSHVPDAIMDLVMEIVAEVALLNVANMIESAVTPATPGLYGIPSYIFALYRSVAERLYSDEKFAGNMLLYNDCLRLSDRLQVFLEEQKEADKKSTLQQHLKPSIMLQLDNDIEMLESFGNRAYGREMESQRMIIKDLLDNAQGFQSCTDAPFAAECDNAVSMTIDRIHEVKRQWKPVLSDSALLQSLGSLVSTAINKFITEVEDMPGIGVDESKKLAGYVKSMSSLSSLFVTEDQDMTKVYVPSWFKFQYLGEILESNLADIRYLWEEGELRLEMTVDEVVDLIEALFAESPHPLRRYALSSLVNNLLHNAKPIPFEFLINGQFLRTSIDEFLTQNGISAETTLNVEYTRALIPPLHVASFEHDDWVSAVDVLSGSSPAGGWAGGLQSGQERILSASYDGLLRVWNLSGDMIAISEPPNSGGRITSLKTAKWLSYKKVVAAGLDSVVRVYNYEEDTRALTPSLELYNHRWGISDVAVHGPSNRILSASGDTTISLFSGAAKDNPTAPASLLPTSTAASNKRQKLSKSDKTIPSRGALSALSGHASPVTSVIFKPDDPTVAYSTSQDHTLRTWDLPTSTCVDTRTTGHSLLSIAALQNINLLAAGTSARHITLLDPRASATQIAVMTLRGHLNAVAALDTDPHSEYGLVSGSHDGTCRIWDVRSVRPSAGETGQVGESVYVIERDGMGGKVKASGDGVKVFGVEWDRATGIVSAGEDKKVQINRGVGAGGSST